MFYLIPGLGADERVFRRLHLCEPTRVLAWLPPLSPDEPLVHYAARLAEAVPAEQACWLVGVSFGGVLALEIRRLRPLTRVVLISSLPAPVIYRRYYGWPAPRAYIGCCRLDCWRG